jgi:hypothetical protein
MKSQEAAGILDAKEKLTQSAKDSFIKEVKSILVNGVTGIDDGKLLCFEVPPTPGSDSIPLEDASKFPEFHRYVFNLYESIARGLNLDSDFKFLPVVDPIALGLKLGIDFDIDVSLPPDIPAWSPKIAAKLALPEIVAKLPSLDIQFPPPVSPAIPMPKFELPQIDDSRLSFTLTAVFDLVPKLPEVFLNFTLSIPTAILQFPKMGLCKAFTDALGPLVLGNPAFKLTPMPTMMATVALVLLRKTANCIVYAAIGSTLGAAPGGMVGAVARSNGETPPAA